MVWVIYRAKREKKKKGVNGVRGSEREEGRRRRGERGEGLVPRRGEYGDDERERGNEERGMDRQAVVVWWWCCVVFPGREPSDIQLTSQAQWSSSSVLCVVCVVFQGSPQ